MSTRPRIGATVLLGIAAVSGLLLPAASAQGSSRSSSSHSESRRVVVQNGEVVVDEHVVDGIRQPTGDGPAGVIPKVGTGGLPDLDRLMEDMMRRMRGDHGLPAIPPLPGAGLPGSTTTRADAHADSDSRSSGEAASGGTREAGGGGAARRPDGARPAPGIRLPTPVDQPRRPAPRAPGAVHRPGIVPPGTVPPGTVPPGIVRPGAVPTTPLPPTPTTPRAGAHPAPPVDARGSGLRRRDPRGNDAPPPVFVELPPDRPSPPPAPASGRTRRQI